MASRLVNFDASGSHDYDGTISSYAWDFGDGNTDTGVTTSHTYTTTGIYYPKLTVTDNDGYTKSTTRKVIVTDIPVASFSIVATGLSIAFDGTSSSDADGTVESYSWDFGDGNFDTGATPTHVYASSASYDVVLTVTDNLGATGEITTALDLSGDIFGSPAIAAFSMSEKLNPLYSGNAYRVKDSSDVEYDVGFNGSVTDEAGLLTFADGGTTSVIIVYNQAATTQGTKNLTPVGGAATITSGGAVLKENGKAYLNQNGSNYTLQFDATDISNMATETTQHIVGTVANGGGTLLYFVAGADSYGTVSSNSNTKTNLGWSFATSSLSYVNDGTGISNAGSGSAFTAYNQIPGLHYDVQFIWSNAKLRGFQASTSYETRFKRMQSLIIYAEASNVATVTSGLNALYSVY